MLDTVTHWQEALGQSSSNGECWESLQQRWGWWRGHSSGRRLGL